MDVSKFSSYLLIKYLLEQEYVLQKDLANKLYKKQQKELKPGTFSSKINRDNLRFKDLRDICEILGYEIHIKKRGEN